MPTNSQASLSLTLFIDMGMFSRKTADSRNALRSEDFSSVAPTAFLSITCFAVIAGVCGCRVESLAHHFFDPQPSGFPCRRFAGCLTKCLAVAKLPSMPKQTTGPNMPKKTPEQQLLLSQIKQVAEGLAQTFAPFTEVVVHDLLDPEHAVLAIHNNLSGREVGQPATELGLARIMDPAYEQIIANYPNQFSDGRQVKSTSIGIKDSKGDYIAALCMNVDLTLFRGFQNMLSKFMAVEGTTPARESLDPASADLIRARIDEFAARMASTPRSLKPEERRSLLKELKMAGLLEVRRAMDTIAVHLGVSRATVYSDAK